MWQDPIVKEVRKAGEKLAQKANYSVHTFFEDLRQTEIKYPDRIVKEIAKRKLPCVSHK